MEFKKIILLTKKLANIVENSKNIKYSIIFVVTF